MPSSTLGSRGDHFQQATTLMARRMPFITCVVPVVSLSYERWKKNPILTAQTKTSDMRSIRRVLHLGMFNTRFTFLSLHRPAPFVFEHVLYITMLTGCHQYTQYKHRDPLCFFISLRWLHSGLCVRRKICIVRLASSQRISDF